MRKFLCTLSSLILFGTTTSQIVACSSPFDNPNLLRITLVTDGHTIDDNSFNQSTYNGAITFANQFNQWVNANQGVPANYQHKKAVISYIQPVDTTLSSLLQSYTISAVMNSKVTLASGFIQKNALVAAQNQYLKGKNRYVLVDSDTENNLVPPENKDLAGILYKAEQSGFLAGIAALCWLIANADQYGGYHDNNLKLSTYGGVDNVPGVVNYMYGFYWAINYFNQIIVPAPSDNPVRQQMINWISDLASSNKIAPIQDDKLYKVQFVTLPNQFSRDFVQASSGSKAVNDALIKNGTNVIFAVSGPQTEDTIGAIRSANSNAKIIGVDTDQAVIYKNSASLFLTSALKNITDSVTKTLWNALGLDNVTHDSLGKGVEYKEFHEDAIPQGGKDYVGVANNSAISKIYQSLIQYNKFIEPGGILDKITNGWMIVEQQATQDNTMWMLTPTIDPFES